MVELKIDMDAEEIKSWLDSAIEILKKYAREHNEDVVPEVGTINEILKEVEKLI